MEESNFMKSLSVLATVSAVILAIFASAAFAGVQDFGKFSLNVPEGWKASQSGPFAVLTKNDNSVMLQICIDSLNGSSLKNIVDSWTNEFKKQDWYKEVNVTGPDDDGSYIIRAIAPNGANSQAMFAEDKGEYIVISTVGPDEVIAEAGDEISAILGTMAKRHDFGIFKASIPEGWTANQDGNTVGIVKDDKTASMSVSVEENNGTSLKDLADAFMKELNGRNLETDAQGNAVFEFTASGGANSKAVLNADEKHFALIVITLSEGVAQSTLDNISAIIDSISFRDI